jgi:hypothetical protein
VEHWWISTKIHSFTTYKDVPFMVTTVRTSNLTDLIMLLLSQCPVDPAREIFTICKQYNFYCGNCGITKEQILSFMKPATLHHK